jgi:hypothetical protein
MASVDDKIKEATEAVTASLKRQYQTGLNPVEQAFAQAEEDGNPIAGDPETTRYHELPMEYQTEAPPLTMKQLAQWGLSSQEIASFAERGILGPDFMNASANELQEAAIGASRQAQRQAQIDAGPYAEKTLVDHYMEGYWEGKMPHPKTGKLCSFRSWIATMTVPVGINGRIWFFVKGRLYRKVPMEVLNILTQKAVALRDEAILSSIYSMQGQVPLLEKIRQQGGQTSAGQWADSMLSSVTDRMQVNTSASLGL